MSTMTHADKYASIFRACVVAFLALTVGACDSGGAPPRPHATLTGDADGLWSAFNADSGKVRAIFLASPTCGECIRGASELQRRWLAKDSSQSIAVYVVWSPQLGAQEKHVASAMKLVPDTRVRHFWDGEMLVGTAFQFTLSLPAAAWDVWMLFDIDAMRRADSVPVPAWWEHQLRVGPADRHLDPDRFASHAEALKSVARDHR